jgi:hypothetical protein
MGGKVVSSVDFDIGPADLKHLGPCDYDPCSCGALKAWQNAQPKPEAPRAVFVLFDDSGAIAVSPTRPDSLGPREGVARYVLADSQVLPGWTCPSPSCGVFNGTAKVDLKECRCCGEARP